MEFAVEARKLLGVSLEGSVGQEKAQRHKGTKQMSIRTYRDLLVWQKSMSLVTEVYKVTSVFPREEAYGLTSQVRRCAVSIPSNIAEGYGRYYFKENKQFCFYSRGSILETKTWLIKARNRKLINNDKFDNLIEKLEIIHKKLNAYMKFIGKNQASK